MKWKRRHRREFLAVEGFDEAVDHAGDFAEFGHEDEPSVRGNVR